MNYFIKKLEEEISDLEHFNTDIQKLMEKADKGDTVESWDNEELFRWTKHDSLFSKTYKDETGDRLEWSETGPHSMSVEICDTARFKYYLLDMNYGQGTDFAFYGYDDERDRKKFNKKYHVESYTLDFVIAVCHSKLIFLQTKLAALKAKTVDSDKKDELMKKLSAVDTANALMSIFGLKLDKDSQEKVESWRKQYDNLNVKTELPAVKGKYLVKYTQICNGVYFTSYKIFKTEKKALAEMSRLIDSNLFDMVSIYKENQVLKSFTRGY